MYGKTRTIGVVTLAAAMAVAIHTTPARGQYQLQKLTTDDPIPPGANYLFYAEDVAVSGDRLVVAARYSDMFDLLASGFAYVYRREGLNWIQEARLSPSDGVPLDRFASNLAISGDRIAVAAWGLETVYVFHRTDTGWIEEAQLTPADAPAVNTFGRPVTMSDDVVVVGAANDDQGGRGAGAVYVFRRTGTDWVQEAKLIAGDAVGGSGFGGSVDVDGNYLIVGSPADDEAGKLSGAAYVFRYDGSNWVEEDKFVGSDTVAGDRFGLQVALAAEYALVAIPYHEDPAGGVYLFRREGTEWIEQPKLTPDDAQGVSGFQIALSTDHALLGYGGDDDAGTNSGAAYVFTRSGDAWTQVAKLTAGDAAAWDMFGGSLPFGRGVAIANDYLVVASAGGGLTEGTGGSAYIFCIPPSPCIPTLSAWGVAIMGLLLLAAGAVLLRRNRAAGDLRTGHSGFRAPFFLLAVASVFCALPAMMRR